MRSCDTNILLYALNTDCSEHSAARRYFDSIVNDNNFAICELVLLELYVLLRSSKVLRTPLSAREASEYCISLRENPAWRLIDYDPRVSDAIWAVCASTKLAGPTVFDTRLALTLEHHGVKEFATRNVKDFKRFSGLDVFNPIDR